jgi:hypothetical protein
MVFRVKQNEKKKKNIFFFLVYKKTRMSIKSLKVSELKQALDDLNTYYSPKDTKAKLAERLEKSLLSKSPILSKSPRRRKSPRRYSPRRYSPRRYSPVRRSFRRHSPFEHEPVVPVAVDPLAFKVPKQPKSPWERKAEHIGIINKVATAINNLHNVVTTGGVGSKASFNNHKKDAELALYEARQYHNMPLNYYNRLLKAINAYETKYGYNLQ